MKEFKVISGPRYNPLVTIVQLSGVNEGERLTPAMAARAACAAIGGRNRVTVWSNDDHGYRLYANRCRKLVRSDEELDALDRERADTLAREED